VPGLFYYWHFSLMFLLCHIVHWIILVHISLFFTALASLLVSVLFLCSFCCSLCSIILFINCCCCLFVSFNVAACLPVVSFLYLTLTLTLWLYTSWLYTSWLYTSWLHFITITTTVSIEWSYPLWLTCLPLLVFQILFFYFFFSTYSHCNTIRKYLNFHDNM